MSFSDAIFTCLFEKFFNFTDRASRSEFWWFCLFSNLLCGILPFIPLFSMITNWVVIILIIPNLAVLFRRVRDTGYSALWALCPIVNVVLAFLPSSSEVKNEL